MSIAEEILSSESAELREISDFIHEHPETGYQEFQAAGLLKKYLADHDFTVTENYGNVETAFKAVYASPNAGEDVPLFGFVGEYDALQGLGHGCGHNLIATSALAGVVTARKLLESAGVPFRIAYLGTPAEETLGGKAKMICGGAFKEVAVALEAHPLHRTIPDPGALSASRCTISFYGKASHAASAPEKGLNALEAASDFICRIRDWRKEIKPRERVHGILTKGGDAPNIIPEYAEAFFYVRAPNERDVSLLKVHLEKLADAAAKAAGCRAEIKWQPYPYKGVIFNQPLNEALLPIWKEITGEEIPMTNGTENMASTDIGNVSYMLPCAQYHFGITGGIFHALHTVEFREDAATDFAFKQAMNIGTAMAMVCKKYFCEPGFRTAVHTCWLENMKTAE